MSASIKRIGILTGGGDAPGLNAVIRAVVKAATKAGIECVGLEDSFDGLIYPERSRVLTWREVTGILRLELGTSELALLALGLLVVEFGCGSFAVILTEVFLRPIRTEIDPLLPVAFQPTHPSIRMSRRIESELFILILAPSILTGGVLAAPGGGAPALAKDFVVASLVTACYAAVIGWALVERVSAPVRDLVLATRAVTAGDLTVRVPMSSTDEHLALTQSFNAMVGGLREREALHAALGFYIDPAVAERVMAEGAYLTGEAAEVSVMFVDIVGFTTRARVARSGCVGSQ